MAQFDQTVNYESDVNGGRGFVVGYGRFVVRFNWLIFLLSLAVVGVVTSGMKNVGFGSDYRMFFDDKNPYLLAFEKVERTYSSLDNVVWALKSSEYDATDQRMAQIVFDLTDRAWQTPYSIRVDSYTNFQHTIADGDDLTVQNLVDDPALIDNARSQELKDIIKSEPALAKRMLSEDEQTTAVFVTAKMAPDDPQATTEVMNYAWALADEIMEQHPEVHVAVSGSIGVSNAFFSSAQNDIRTLFPAMIGILTLVLYLLTRSIPGALASLLVVLSAAFMALAMSGWLNIKLSPPSANTPTLVLTVAVADCIHILITTLIGMHRGLAKNDAIIESLRVNWGPVFLTSVTTAIGFASLNFMDTPPIRDMGNLAAFGAMFAWILSITMFPALLSMLPIKARSSLDSQSKFMTAFGRGVIALRHPIVIVMIGICVYSAYLIPTLSINDNFVEYFDHRVRFRNDSDWIDKNTSGIMVVNYSIESGSYGSISNPEYLAKIEAFANWARTQPVVEHVSVFTDVMKRVNKSMHGDQLEYYTVPERTNEAAQYLLLYEMQLPYGMDLNDQINVDKTSTRLMLTLENLTTEQLADLQDKADEWMRSNWPEFMRADPAGQAVMFSFINKANLKQMTIATPLALVLISGLLILFLRSVKLGLISLVPNLMPPLVAFGAYAALNNEVGFWASMIAATALGLIVDATVHMLSKYQRARTEFEFDSREAILYTFSTVGTALLVATIVLVMGFSVMAFSTWTINKMMGIMVASTVALAFAIDFLLLPALLILFDSDRQEDKTERGPVELDTGSLEA